MLKRYIWFAPAILVFVSIFLLSTVLTVPMEIKGFSALDKVQHAFAYFVLTICLLFGYHKGNDLTAHRWLQVFAFCVLYGLLLEWVQYGFFSLRHFDWLDALANTVGAMFGVMIFKIIRHVI